MQEVRLRNVASVIGFHEAGKSLAAGLCGRRFMLFVPSASGAILEAALIYIGVEIGLYFDVGASS
jgi:hypothetical protein